VWTYPLTTLYQNSLQTGTLPSDWLLADVTPILGCPRKKQHL